MSRRVITFILCIFLLPSILVSQDIKYKLVKSEKVNGKIMSWYFSDDLKYATVPKIAVQQDKINWKGSVKKNFF